MNVVKAFLDASIRRDRTQLAELADPDIELHGTVGGVQEGQVYRGLAEVVREYDEVDGEAWEERRLEPEGFLDADDHVVVMFHEFRRGKGSGVELEARHRGCLHSARRASAASAGIHGSRRSQ